MHTLRVSGERYTCTALSCELLQPQQQKDRAGVSLLVCHPSSPLFALLYIFTAEAALEQDRLNMSDSTSLGVRVCA